jgi:hypothetical protein
MGDGTKENPYNHDDMLRLRKENGDTAVGLDLSGKVFEEGIDLSGLQLEGINLKDAVFPTHFGGQGAIGAKFNGSNLSRADFRGVNLQYAQFGMLNNKLTCLGGADFRNTILLNASFQGSDLTCAIFGKSDDKNFGPATLEKTDFRNTNLFLTNFVDCYFYGTKFEGAFVRGVDISNAHLEEADWGSYIIGEEKKGEYYFAEYYYRKFKKWYSEAGMYDIAGEFFFREMTVKRKNLWVDSNIIDLLYAADVLGLNNFTIRHLRVVYFKKHLWPFKPFELIKAIFPKKPFAWIWSMIMNLVCGYGERPERVVISAIVIIFGLALAYYFLGSFSSSSFLDTLYYSVVSFVALGYGSWAPQPVSWAKYMGAIEAVLGVFMMALFLVTFTRKMTR